MKPPPLGTILPNRATERKADIAFEGRKATHLCAAKVLFKGMTHRFEDGEDRFYENANKYYIYNGRKLSFERRKDGYFYSVASSTKKDKK